MATRWRCPPDSWCGYLAASSGSSPTSASRARARPAASRAGHDPVRDQRPRRSSRRSASAGRGCRRGPGTRSARRAGSPAARSRAVAAMSFPSKRIEPAGRRHQPQHRPADGRLARAALADQPEAERARAASRRLTPSTARTGPNRTARSLMSSSGVPACPPAAGDRRPGRRRRGHGPASALITGTAASRSAASSSAV